MLNIFVAETIEPLADRLAARLEAPGGSPFDQELIAVPGGGMNRWIRLHLAQRLGASPGRTDGVASNIAFVFPGNIRSALESATEPWAIERLVWVVLSIISDPKHSRALGAAAHIPEGATWYGRARSIADLFDHYSVHRPAMVRSWNNHDDVDSVGDPLSSSQRWQPELWRLVRAHIKQPSVAERMPDVLATLRSTPAAFEHALPKRLAVFGTSSFPGGQEFIDLARALSVHREVDLYLVAPSLAARQSAPVHPLLQTWAKPSADTAELSRNNRLVETLVPPDSSSSASRTKTAATLLQQLQSDIRANVAPTNTSPVDPSVQLHECFGPVRQLEACRDAILHALADDQTLEESDITVLVPDIVDYAPLIPSVFGPSANNSAGSTGETSTPPLRYVVTDRSLESSNDYADGVLNLLRLLPSRFSRTDVLDFLAQPSVKVRHQISDDDSIVIDNWINDSTIRWGLNPHHRHRWGIPTTFDVTTWRSGVDQLLTGVAVFDDAPALGPGDIAARGVEGGAVDVLGRLSSIIDSLEILVECVEARQSVANWVTWVIEATGRVLATSADDAWQHDQFRQVVATIADDAQAVHEQPILTFAEFSQLLSRGLQGRPGRNRFFSGGITVTSMQPMRWLPSRVTCIVGLDESVFAAPVGNGDDLVSQQSQLGDIDPRSDRRQAVLETVLSTSDRLIITRTAANQRTNAEVPPPIALSELEDVLAKMTGGAFAPHAHALHLFDSLHLDGSASPVASFDQNAVASATARAGRHADSAWLAQPLDPKHIDTLTVGDLRSFLAVPARTFFTSRLNVRLSTADEVPAEHLMLSLSGLDQWSLADDLLNSRQSSPADWSYYHSRNGSLPPGILSTIESDKLIQTAGELSAAAADAFHPGLPADPVPIGLTVDDTRVVGVVEHVVSDGAGQGLLRTTKSKVNPKNHLDCWLDLMLVTLAEPANDWRSVLIGTRKQNRKVNNVDTVTMRVAGSTPAERHASASRALSVVLDLYRRALCEPLPLFAKTSGEIHAGTKPDSWTPFAQPGESKNAYNSEVWPDFSIDDLLELPVLPHDPDGQADTRVARYSEVLWTAVDDSLVADSHD